MPVVLSTTSRFAEFSKQPIQLLKDEHLDFVPNPYGRKVTAPELIALLKKYQPLGILSGLEDLTEDILMSAKPYLKVISRVGAGLDNIDLTAAGRNHIQVFNTQDVVTQAVCEMTVGLIFALSRQIAYADRQLRLGKWDKVTGFLVQGKKIGILGYGRIGKQVAWMMKNLQADIYVYDPYIEEKPQSLNSLTFCSSMLDLFQTCDMVSVHVPLNSATRGMICREVLLSSKPGLLLVNTSRGEVIDENGLCEALDSKIIFAAALDVFSKEPYCGPLLNFPQVILTPHISSYAKETRINMEIMATKNLLFGIGSSPT